MNLCRNASFLKLNFFLVPTFFTSYTVRRLYLLVNESSAPFIQSNYFHFRDKWMICSHILHTKTDEILCFLQTSDCHLCDCCEANPGHPASRNNNNNVLLLVRYSVSVPNVTVKALSVRETSWILSYIWNHDSSLSVISSLRTRWQEIYSRQEQQLYFR